MRLALQLLGLLLLAYGPAGAAAEEPSYGDEWELTRPGQSARSERAAAPRSVPTRPPAVRAEELYARQLAALLTAPGDDLAYEQLRAREQARSGSLEPLAARLRQLLAVPERRAGAMLALARVLAELDRWEEAAALLADAAGQRESRASALLLRAKLLRARGQEAAASADLEALLAGTASRAERRAALELLRASAIDARALDGARAAQQRLEREGGARGRDPGELARLLAQAGQHEAAAAEYQLLSQRARGAEAARFRAAAAREQFSAGAFAAAASSIAAALPAAGPALSAELRELEVRVERALGRLPELAERREQEARRGRRGSFREAAQLWEELGDSVRAAQGYREALAHAGADRELRARLAEALASAGRLVEAEREYALLLAASPSDGVAWARRAELLRTLGRREQALRLLRAASMRARNDVALHQSLRGLYERWGEPALAQHELELLARLAPESAETALGRAEQALAQGDRARAAALLRGPREPADAAGQAQLARVLADHDLLAEALPHAERAVALAPDEPHHRRVLASMLERAGNDQRAERIWQELLEQPAVELALRDEARRHLVALWQRTGRAPERAEALRARLRAEPDRAEDTRLLAELLARDPGQAGAEVALLEARLARAPRDVEALLALARAHERRAAPQGALSALERLLALRVPESTRELDRALRLALAHPHHDQARALVALARELAPNSSSVARAAGDFHRERREGDEARLAYERAVALDPNDRAAQLALAEDCLQRGERSRALELLPQVVTLATRDELVARAAALLGALDRERLEAALRAPAQLASGRTIHRRLLLALYERSLVPLAERSAQGTATAAEQAQLASTVARAAGLLLSALDGAAGERAVALALLGAAPVPSLREPLLAIAGDAQRPVPERAAAIVAVGRMADGRAAPQLRLLALRVGRHLRPATLWALAACAGQREQALLYPALSARDHETRSMALLLLARAPLRAEAAARVRGLRDDRHPAVRLSALWALALLEPGGHEQALRSESQVGPLGPLLLTALAPDHPRLVEALFAGAPAARTLAAARLFAPLGPPPALPAPSFPFVLDAYLSQLLRAAATPSAAPELPRSRWSQIIVATLRALEGDGPALTSALEQLAPHASGLAPQALLDAGGCVPPALAQALGAALHERLAELSLTAPPAPRAAALALLVRSAGADHPAVAAALRADEAEHALARQAVLVALAELPEIPESVRPELERLLDPARDWPTRRRAALALRPALPPLALQREPLALVREAAAQPRSAAAPSCRGGLAN